MKAGTITAAMALLLAIPLILGKRKLPAGPNENGNGEIIPSDETRRYAIDEFLSESVGQQ